MVLAVWDPEPHIHRDPGQHKPMILKCLKNRFGLSGIEYSVFMENPGAAFGEAKRQVQAPLPAPELQDGLL